MLTPLYDIVQQSCSVLVLQEVSDCLHQIIENQYKSIGTAWQVVFQIISHVSEQSRFSAVEHIFRLFKRYTIEVLSLTTYGIVP